jgi:hypothetical protein
MERIILCETCFERGRRRPATHLSVQMCDDCFTGRPFRPAETLGEGVTRRPAPRRPLTPEQRKRAREAWRRWKARHRADVNAAARERKRLRRLLATEAN